MDAGVCPRCVRQLACECCRQVREIELSPEGTPLDADWRRCRCGRLGVPVDLLFNELSPRASQLRLLEEIISSVREPMLRLTKPQLFEVIRQAVYAYDLSQDVSPDLVR